jgi:LPS sulfotransferase NodH
MLVVATIARSGSSLLCACLRSSGVGDIREYLNFDNGENANRIRKWGSEGMLRFIRKNGGMKVFRETTALIEIELRRKWLTFMNNQVEHLVYLEREDTVGQAISQYIAHYARIWQVHNDELEEKQRWLSDTCPYEFHEIYHHWCAFMAEKAFWRENLPLVDVPQLRLDYDNLVEDPIGCTARVLDFMGRDPKKARGAPRFKPSAPKRSELRERFLEDLHRLHGTHALETAVDHVSLYTGP